MDEKKNEIILFENQGVKLEVNLKDETVWLTQKQMAELFGKDRKTITRHIQNIYKDEELSESSVCSFFEHTAEDGKNYNTKYYNLDVIIAVGFKVNSQRAIDFRLWAINVLKQYSVKGYVLDKERLKNGSFLDENYFDELLQEIREIRISERNFYQKITDIYSTSLDYNSKSPLTQEFFKTVQNKMHYATHGNTAAEVIVERANHEKEHMGLTNWKNSPNGKIMVSDVVIAKNYLTKNELKSLERIVTMYLDYAEDQAERHIPMTMEDWKNRLDIFLQFNERDILDNPGKVSHKVAESFALSEFEKYRVVQDRLFESDFDKFLLDMKKENCIK